MIQHIGVGKPFVTGHHWPIENLVSSCYKLSSPEAEAETEFGMPDIYRDQHLPRARGRSQIGQKSQWDAGLTKAWQLLRSSGASPGHQMGPHWAGKAHKAGFLEAEASPEGDVHCGPTAGSLPIVGQPGFLGGDLHGASLCQPRFCHVICSSARGEMWCSERKCLGLWIWMFCKVRQQEWWGFLLNNICSSILKITSKDIYLLKKYSQTWSKGGHQ